MWRSGFRTPHFPCTQHRAFWSQRSSGCSILWYVFTTSHSGAIWRNVSPNACLHWHRQLCALPQTFKVVQMLSP